MISFQCGLWSLPRMLHYMSPREARCEAIAAVLTPGAWAKCSTHVCGGGGGVYVCTTDYKSCGQDYANNVNQSKKIKHPWPYLLKFFSRFSFSSSLRSPSPPSKYIPNVIYKSESFYRKTKAVSNTALIRCVSPRILAPIFSWCYNTSTLLVMIAYRLQSSWWATSSIFKTMRLDGRWTVTWAIKWLGLADKLYFSRWWLCWGAYERGQVAAALLGARAQQFTASNNRAESSEAVSNRLMESSHGL